MRRLLKLLPYLAAATNLVALMEIALRPNWLPFGVVAIGAVALATSGTLAYQALWNKSSVAPSAMPGLLAIGVAFAFLFLGSQNLRFAVAVLSSLLFLVLTQHLAETAKISDASPELKAFSEWSALVALFGLSAGLLASVTFLNWPQFLVAGVFAAVAIYASLAVGRLGSRAGWLLSAASAVFLLEGFIVVMFLPFSHWVGAGLIAVIAYLLFSLLSGASARTIRKNLIWVGVICGALLLTARWR
jgi:hypothetical protein